MTAQLKQYQRIAEMAAWDGRDDAANDNYIGVRAKSFMAWLVSAYIAYALLMLFLIVTACRYAVQHFISTGGAQ